MVKTLLFIVLLVPFAVRAQYIPTDDLETDNVDLSSGQHVRSTYWHTLRKATLSNPLNLYFRITAYDNKYFLGIKASKAGMGFLVARGQPLDLLMEDGNVVTLYNREYQQSCKGCGSRMDRGDEPGVSLIYPIKSSNMEQLRAGYAVRLRFYAEDSYMGAAINFTNGELLHEEANLIWNVVNK